MFCSLIGFYFHLSDVSQIFFGRKDRTRQYNIVIYCSELKDRYLVS